MALSFASLALWDRARDDLMRMHCEHGSLESERESDRANSKKLSSWRRAVTHITLTVFVGNMIPTVASHEAAHTAQFFDDRSSDPSGSGQVFLRQSLPHYS
jgi:hypothetical protein